MLLLLLVLRLLLLQPVLLLLMLLLLVLLPLVACYWVYCRHPLRIANFKHEASFNYLAHLQAHAHTHAYTHTHTHTRSSCNNLTLSVSVTNLLHAAHNGSNTGNSRRLLLPRGAAAATATAAIIARLAPLCCGCGVLLVFMHAKVALFVVVAVVVDAVLLLLLRQLCTSKMSSVQKIQFNAPFAYTHTYREREKFLYLNCYTFWAGFPTTPPLRHLSNCGNSGVSR